MFKVMMTVVEMIKKYLFNRSCSLSIVEKSLLHFTR